MRITITTTGEMTRYAVKNGQIHYVKLSKPCAISDLDDPLAKLDITPYLDKRTVYYGVFVDDPNGCCKGKNYQKVLRYTSGECSRSIRYVL